jgi:thioredoxin-dependent peroxiredoxin
MLTVGQDAPDFTLESHRGQTVHLGDLRGRQRALLVFYPKDDTPGCTAQLCAIRDNYASLQSSGIVPFGINGDTADEHTAFAEAQQYQFDLLMDPGLEVTRAYGAERETGPRPERTVYVVDTDGRIAFAQRGAPSPAEILAALGDQGK